MALQEDSAAPKFKLESDEGTLVSLSDYAGRWLVVYFYPKDNTPGCTRQAQGFADAAARLKGLGADVVGVSRDSVASHRGFKDKFGINFPLLSDPDMVAHRAYGAWGTKTMYGETAPGVIRSTFLISPQGKIARTWGGVKVDGHVDKVIAALEESSAPSEKKKSAVTPRGK